MSAFPFSPKGVEDKLSALYQLTDTDLALQATAIKTNFKQWLLSNFTFNTSQVIYINNIESRSADYFGMQCAMCFTSRLPITLVYPTPPSTPGYAKWSMSGGGLQVEANGNGQMTATGSLTFEIIYR